MGRQIDSRVFTSVVLPARLGPRTPNTEPRGTAKRHVAQGVDACAVAAGRCDRPWNVLKLDDGGRHGG